MKIFSLKSKKSKVKVRVIKKSPVLVPIRPPFKLQGALLSILVGLVFSGLFSYGVYVFAIPPTSPYAPGATLNPNCTPGSTNCTVNAPVYFTGSTLDLGTNNLVGATPLQIKYNSSNYATLSVDSSGNLTISTSGSSGNISFNSPGSSNASILSNSGILNLGGSLSGDESINLDFHDYANKVVVTSNTGVSSIDFGSLNLSTTGTLTLGGSTTGTLVTRVVAGAPTESDTNGSLVVDSTTGRLYFRYSNAWHYIAQTGGFQIPNFETVDPISGEEIQEGDFVVGMIDKSLEDDALHGVWVRWETIKQQLAEEIALTGGLVVETTSTISGETTELTTDTTQETTETVQNVSSKSLLGKVKNVLSIIGITIKDGITKIKNLAVEKLTASVARIDKLEMTDSATGEIYCSWIENGELKREKGECGSVEVEVADSNSDQEEDQIIQEAADKAAETALEKVEEKIDEKVEEKVKEHLEGGDESEVGEESETESQETQTEEVSEDAPGNSLGHSQSGEAENSNSQSDDNGKSDEEKGKPEKEENKSDESETQEVTVEPTIIDVLVENSTSALFERANEFMNSVVESMKDWPANSKEFSAGLMDPLKNLIETLFTDPLQKVSQNFETPELMDYSLADLHGSSSELNEVINIALNQAVEDLQVAVEVSKFSQNNFAESTIRFNRGVENNLINLAYSSNQIASEAWLLDPTNLLKESGSNTYRTAKSISSFRNFLAEEIIDDLMNFSGFSKYMQNNLAGLIVSLNDNSDVETISFDNPLDNVKESLWLLNPVNLPIAMKNDFTNNFMNLPNIALDNQNKTEDELKNFSSNAFLVIQNSEVAIFNAGLTISNTTNGLLAPFTGSLESIWVLNPMSLINEGVSDFRNTLNKIQNLY